MPHIIEHVLGLALLGALSVRARECDASDFDYEYTACNEHGERWRVAVPRPSANCEGGFQPRAEKGLNCSFTCGPGKFLDLETQKCRPCLPGRYSLGGGVRFDEFIRLPSGFNIDNFDLGSDQLLNQLPSAVTSCPKETGWVVRNSELLYVPTPCVSKLSFTTTLVRPGYVEYSYRMPKNARGLSLNVVVKNELCQSYRDELKSLLSGLQSEGGGKGGEETSGGDWQRRRVDLKTGPNVIAWTVAGDQTQLSEPIHVARIDVVGMAFTRQCALCPAGTYSEAGAAECRPCDAGYYSTKGAEACGRCPLSQFSGPKASACIDRPACSTTDYYPVTEPCVNGKTHVTYRKVLPAVCREDLYGAAKLPPAEPEKSCPKCNPGMSLNSQGLCEFCSKDHFSDGNECKQCPVGTVPNYGYQFVWWNSLPKQLQSRCEYISEDALTGCNIGAAWVPAGDALVTARSHQRGIAMELILSVDEGFFNPLSPTELIASSQNPVAQITFVFETRCRDLSCVFYFIEDMSPTNPNSYYRFIASFNGTQQRHVYQYSITRRNPGRYMFAFLRSRAVDGDDAVEDQAIIYSINVTNVASLKGVQGGGASACLPCPVGPHPHSCIPCPPGHYMTELGRVCTRCPSGTALNISSDRIGLRTCVACGPGLESPDGVSCRSSGHFTLPIKGSTNATRTYDLSAFVNQSFVATGVRVFAREGTSYFHSFNVSLLGGLVVCIEQFDASVLKSTGYTEQNRDSVEGGACRLTAIPVSAVSTKNSSLKSIAYVTPVLLGTRLAAISTELEYNGWKLTDKLLEYEGIDKASRPQDIHFFFEAPSTAPSETCPRGAVLFVTARCDPNEPKFQFRLPRSCPDGTCDGCLYHAIFESASACPICTKEDYTVIKGECLDGQQTIHSIPAKHCVLSGAESRERKAACSVLTAHLRLLIIVASTALFGLIIAIFIVCQRNRKLEYKYMNLTKSKVGGDGMELPGAESCGIEEDEEEEEIQDRVVFSKGKNRLFGGFKKSSTGIRRERDDGDDSTAFVALENED